MISFCYIGQVISQNLFRKKNQKSFFGGSDKSDKALVTDVFQGIFCAEMCKLSVIQGNEENVLWTIFRFEISYPTVHVL